MRNKLSVKGGWFSRFVRYGLVILLAFNICVVIVAFFDNDNSDEAPIGNFDTEDFNEGWKYTCEGNTVDNISLPMFINTRSGEEVIITNTLPDNIVDGMNIMVRASMEDVVIYVDGRKREEYSSNSVRNMSFYIPSAYVVAALGHEDAGKQIDIHFTIKAKGSLNKITIGHGNNGWFAVIYNGLPVSFIALVVLIAGVITTIASLFLGRRYKAAAGVYLGILVIDVTVWMFSESILRQLIFSRPSLSQYFSYVSIELVAALACQYFDEVQHRIYHRRYVVLEAITVVVVPANIILNYTQVVPFYKTLPICHIIMAVSAVVTIINIVGDIRTGRIRTYRFSMMGIILFILISLVELARFYISQFAIFGSFVCIGLIGLITGTVIQTVSDVFGEFRENEKRRIEMMNNTIETIAGAIDARDEYTGGHSERVGIYASMLARRMKEEGRYDLDEEDIVRVHYIGLVHDIGKIGVADSVLNKAGKLTAEEFNLMKRHTEIGFELMSSMGQEIEGVLDGIRFHHERYDGTGYPDGLTGEDIPLVARILCIADSYDAMTSNRVYRKRLTSDEVRSELLRCSGTQFDPKLIEVFIRLLEEGKLRESTVEGMAADTKGEVTGSAMLESRLQSDLLEGIRIMHPSHVRMICYMIKLMEKKGRSYQVIFAGPSDDELSGNELTGYFKKLSNVVGQNISNHDLTVRYTDRLSVIALFDRTDEERDRFADMLRQNFPDIHIENL